MWIFKLILSLHQLIITLCICPDIHLPRIIQCPEGAAIGTIIYSSNITVNSKDSRWEDRGAPVAIKYNTTTSSYQLILSVQGDVDESVEIRFIVLDINEYPAIFTRQEWRFISMNENVKSGTILTTLRDRYTDRDCYSKYTFKIIPPLKSAPGETEDHLILDTEDRLVLAKPFDAEELKCQSVPSLVKTVKIELWEEDSYQNELMDTVTLTITITDIDDQEPKFVKPGCTNTCPDCVVRQYDVGITTFDSGLLNISIQAMDTDTIPSKIIYNIEKVEDTRYRDLFEISETTGELILKKPFSYFLNGTDVVDDFHVKITIQASQFSSNDVAKAVILVTVENLLDKFRTTDTGNLCRENTWTPDSDNDLIIYISVPVTSVVVVIIIVVIVVVICCLRRSEKKPSERTDTYIAYQVKGSDSGDKEHVYDIIEKH